VSIYPSIFVDCPLCEGHRRGPVLKPGPSVCALHACGLYLPYLKFVATRLYGTQARLSKISLQFAHPPKKNPRQPSWPRRGSGCSTSGVCSGYPPPCELNTVGLYAGCRLSRTGDTCSALAQLPRSAGRGAERHQTGPPQGQRWPCGGRPITLCFLATPGGCDVPALRGGVNPLFARTSPDKLSTILA
jgi:hypothetical protein